LIAHKRVGNYKDIKKALQDTANAPQPSTDGVHDEEEARLQAEADAAIAALREYQASKTKTPAAQSSEDSDLVHSDDAFSSVEADHSPID
jgi:hypothetical protein